MKFQKVPKGYKKMSPNDNDIFRDVQRDFICVILQEDEEMDCDHVLFSSDFAERMKRK